MSDGHVDVCARGRRSGRVGRLDHDPMGAVEGQTSIPRRSDTAPSYRSRCGVPSTENWTLAMPIRSVAVAVTVTVPLTTEPAAGS